MGNESGEWIMHGMKWDNPDCIHSVDEAIKYINEFGFLPLFKNDIDGFSLEERTVPEYWWSDNPEIDPWMWPVSYTHLDVYKRQLNNLFNLHHAHPSGTSKGIASSIHFTLPSWNFS